MAFSNIESRFRIPDKSAKAPSRILNSIQSDMQILRDSLTILNVFISPFEEVFTQMIDPKQTQPTINHTQPAPLQESQFE